MPFTPLASGRTITPICTNMTHVSNSPLWAWIVLLGLAARVTSQCVPSTIHLGYGTVQVTSVDSQYQLGDIFYRECSGYSDRQYIGWCPDPHDMEPKIQINFPEVTALHAIVFQTTYTQCDQTTDYRMKAYLVSFDLHFVLPGDRTGTWVAYGENMLALDSHSSEKKVEFAEPLVTRTLKITPKTHNIYPCFRVKFLGCNAESMCPQDWCLNGGKCAGNMYCTCASGFLGDRCNQTANDVKQYNYDFLDIKDGVLSTPDASFDVIGDVTLETSPSRRDGHHHGHSFCHFHSHHNDRSYCQYNGHNGNHNGGGSSHNNQNSHGSSGHCMNNLHNHHHGFTTSMNVHFHHGHYGHCHLFSNGGHLHQHQGASLSYNSQHKQLEFHVSTPTHKWTVQILINLIFGVTHQISTSWHPQTGAHVTVNNQHVGSCGCGRPHSTPHNRTVDLRLGDGHINVAVNMNINMSISALNMFPAPTAQLQIAGISGPYTPAPPPTQPTTLPQTTTTPTTATKTTTLPPVTATSTHAQTTPTTTTPTTTVLKGPACYEYSWQPTIGAVQTQTRCVPGEVCVLYNDQKGYTAKCMKKDLCEAGKHLAPGSCWECCDSYLCNDHCSASSTATCADKPACQTMLATGYDVCSDTKMAVDICSKTCKIC